MFLVYMSDVVQCELMYCHEEAISQSGLIFVEQKVKVFLAFRV